MRLLAFGMAMLAASAVTQPVVLAPPGFSTPTALLIGIHATGPQADLDRLQALATTSGFPSKQMNSPEGWELVIVFPPGTTAKAKTFLEYLKSNEFSALQFRSAYAPTKP